MSDIFIQVVNRVPTCCHHGSDQIHHSLVPSEVVGGPASWDDQSIQRLHVHVYHRSGQKQYQYRFTIDRLLSKY